MAVAAQAIDARVSRRIDTCSDASRPGRRPAGPHRHPAGPNPAEVFAEEPVEVSDTGALRRSGAGPSGVGQVLSWPIGRDDIDSCVKVHKDVTSHWSAYMLVLVPQPIRPVSAWRSRSPRL